MPELTPDVPSVEEIHNSLTKGLFILAKRREETDNGCYRELSWTTTKVNVNVNTTNKRKEKRKGLKLLRVRVNRGAS